jgi:competence protein ComEC
MLRAAAARTVIPTCVIQIGMMPLIAYEFNYITPAGLLLNPPIVAMAGWVLPVGVSMLLALPLCQAAPAPGHIWDLAAHAEGVLLGWMERLTGIADGAAYGHFNVVSPPAPLLFLFYGLLFFAMSETRTLLFARRGFRKAAAACVLIVCAAAATFASPYCRQDRSSLVFVDVGQGDCLHVRTPDGRNYLIDGGGDIDYNVGKKTLLPYLLKNGVGRLDGVFATHLHTDHWKGLVELSREMDVGTAYLYEGNRVRDVVDVAGMDSPIESANDDGTEVALSFPRGAEGAGEEPAGDERNAGNPSTVECINVSGVVYLAQGDSVTIGDGVAVDVLWPPRRTDAEYVAAAEDEENGDGDENASSLIMKIDYEGVTALMTGDAGFEAEEALLKADDESSLADGISALRSRILKVGHHGSKYSTSEEFLTAVDPDAAVIQCGKNTFGHPTAEVLARLAADDIMVFRNDLGGAVMLRIRDGKVTDAEDVGTRFQEN